MDGLLSSSCFQVLESLYQSFSVFLLILNVSYSWSSRFLFWFQFPPVIIIFIGTLSKLKTGIEPNSRHWLQIPSCAVVRGGDQSWFTVKNFILDIVKHNVNFWVIKNGIYTFILLFLFFLFLSFNRHEFVKLFYLKWFVGKPSNFFFFLQLGNEMRSRRESNFHFSYSINRGGDKNRI